MNGFIRKLRQPQVDRGGGLILRRAYIHMSNSRLFDCSRVRQFEVLNKKLNEEVSLTPQFTATKYQ